MKKEIAYTIDTDTVEGIEKAEALQAELYETYGTVLVYPNGLHQVRIIASNEIAS